jgi:hypothetical protein
MSRTKPEIITFKADDALLARLSALPNRSEFIRRAVLDALGQVCPLCGGAGTLSPNQRRHWEQLAGAHSLRTCEECHEVRLVCEHETDEDVHE